MNRALLIRPLAFVCLLSAAAPVRSMPFQSPAVIDTVDSPREWLVLADLNRDARPDVLCASPDNNLRWWRNDPGGVYTQQPDIPLDGGVPVAVVARNVDRDADTDLIVLMDSGAAAGRLHVLKNNGSGQFSKTGEILLSGRLIPGSLPLVEDVDRDGDVDVLQAHQDAAQSAGNDPLSLALNEGNGSFAAPTTVTSALNWPTALAWHDCDENGLPDLLVATTGTTQLRLYRNYQPGGGLLVADLIAAPPAGIQEIVGLGSGRIALRYDGPGSGADSGIQSRLSFEGYLDWTSDFAPVGTNPVVSMDRATWDESGMTGLMHVRRDAMTDERRLYLSLLDRTSQTANLAPTGARAVRCADMDLDGDVDLVMLRESDVILHPNESIRPSTALTDAHTSLNLAHPPVDALTVADILPDSGAEVVGALTAEGSLRVFAIDGLQIQPGTLLTTAAPGVTSVKAGDLDGDGDLDLVFNSPGDDRVKWLRNNGNGSFAAPASVLVKADPGPLDLGDIDRDGDLDVAMTFDDGSVVIAMNSGAATPSWTFEDGGSSGLAPLGIKIADITPGNRLELLVQTFAFAAPDNASTLRYLRYLVFPSPGWYSLTVGTGSASVRGLAVADVEPDGDLDVVAGPGNSPALYLNQGNGTLAAPVPSGQSAFDGARRLIALDLDHNGVQDLVGVSAGGLHATRVNGAGFGPRFEVEADFAGLQLRDVQPISIYGIDDYFVVSDAATPALRLVRNNIRTIGQEVTAIEAAPDVRGGKSAIFAMSLTSQSPPGGPPVSLHSTSFTVRLGAALMPMEIFDQLVTGVEVWRDEGVPGVRDAGDVLVGVADGSLAGDGHLPVSLFSESLAPQQSRRWWFVLRLAETPVAGADQFTVSWGGDALRLTGFVTGDIGGSNVITALMPQVTRSIQLVSWTPLQLWRHGWWGSPDNVGAGGNTADPDGESLANLSEYALGTNPTLADGSPIAPSIDATGRLLLTTALADPPRPDITVIIESSSSLQSASWTTLASRVGAGAWSGPAEVQFGAVAAGRQTFTFVDPVPASPPGRFARLRVVHP